MENNEELGLNEEVFVEDDMSDALTLDDLSSGFLSNPKVGEDPLIFEISKIRKLEGANLLGKTSEGEVFKKNLSNVEYGYEVVTADGNKYTVSSWEVFGKLKSIVQKLKQIKGVKIRLTHLLDGMKAENKKKDKYKVEAEVNGEWKALDRETKEWI